MSAGRPSALADPEFAQEVAAAFAEGLSRAEMCGLFNVKDPATITRWRKDPRVKGILKTLLSDRVAEVTRKIDAKIAAILGDPNHEWTVQELVMLRKEMLGGAMRAETEKADDLTVNEAMAAMDDPKFREDLAAIFERSGSK